LLQAETSDFGPIFALSTPFYYAFSAKEQRAFLFSENSLAFYSDSRSKLRPYFDLVAAEGARSRLAAKRLAGIGV
jgi:hypothetical protein